MPDATAQSLLSRHLLAIAQHIEELSGRVVKLERDITGQEEKMQRYLDRFLEQVDSAVKELAQASTESSKRLAEVESKLSGQQAAVSRLGGLDEKMGLLNVKIEEDLTGVKKELEMLKRWVDNEFKLDETLLRRLEAVPRNGPRPMESKPAPQSK